MFTQAQMSTEGISLGKEIAAGNVQVEGRVGVKVAGITPCRNLPYRFLLYVQDHYCGPVLSVFQPEVGRPDVIPGPEISTDLDYLRRVRWSADPADVTLAYVLGEMGPSP